MILLLVPNALVVDDYEATAVSAGGAHRSSVHWSLIGISAFAYFDFGHWFRPHPYYTCIVYQLFRIVSLSSRQSSQSQHEMTFACHMTPSPMKMVQVVLVLISNGRHPSHGCVSAMYYRRDASDINGWFGFNLPNRCR